MENDLKDTKREDDIKDIKLRNSFGPLTILADLVVIITVFALYFMPNVTWVHITIGVAVMILFQAISFIPAYRKIKAYKAAHKDDAK